MKCNSEPFYKAVGIEGSTLVLMARVKGSDASYITQADVDSIRVDVADVTGTTKAVDDTGATVTDGSAYDTPAVADTVYDALQTDSRWAVDSVGYNLAYKFVPPVRDHTYEVRIKLAMDSGDTLVIGYLVTTR